MDYRVEQVLKEMRHLKEVCDRQPKPVMDQAAIEQGLRMSRNTCKQQPHVFATPAMKNLLVCMGDVQQTQNEQTGEWSTEKLACGAESKAVKWINDVVEAALLKYNGPRVDSYDVNLPIDSPQLYNTDCWLGWKSSIWDIQPGQAEQRKKTFAEYGKRKTALSYDEMVQLVKKDPCLQKAILIMLSAWPEVQAARDVQAISDPFMSKGTGVSYPDYRNDRTTMPNSEETYGQYEVRLAREAYRSGGVEGLVKFGYDWNVYTGYPRNQRGKGRALEAQSRRTNLAVNLVNGPEMERLKNTPFLGTALKDEPTIKQRLIDMTESALRVGYITQNVDYTSWDATVGEGWLILGNAIRRMLTNGRVGKAIVDMRCSCAVKSLLVDGPNGHVHPIYGRMMSGYLDTTLGNTSIHYIAELAANMTVDKDYSSKIWYGTNGKCLMCIGDDYNGIRKPGTDKEYKAKMREYGFDPHTDNKDAFGTMFIQYRLIRKDGKWIMAYNWPRVFRSMLSKEDQKGLGRGGWTLAYYQQLAKLREWPEMMAIPLNILAALDKDHLMLDTPIEQIQQMVLEEDKARASQDVGVKSGNRKARSTAEKLNTNPQFNEHFNSDGTLNYSYFGKLQSELRAVYDPHFLESLGFKSPDLTQVK